MYVIITLFSSVSLAGFLLGEWRVGLIFTLLALLFVWMAFGTKYWIEDEEFLVIKAPIYGGKKIPISRITKVYASSNPLSSPAPSLDRFAVQYDLSGMILISPQDKDALADHLKKINAAIEVLSKR